MAGRPKIRLKRLLKDGKEKEARALAKWLTDRDRGHIVDEAYAWWEEEKEKGSKTVKRIEGSRLTVSNSVDISEDIEVPYEARMVLDRIEESKKELKERAEEFCDKPEELKTIYTMMKRLENERKMIVFEYDFIAFDEYFFQDLQDRVPTPAFHEEMFKLYCKSKRGCVVCPRGHAKSTTARKYILHQILCKAIKYCIIVGASEDMAGQNLRWIRDQLTDNKKILEVYGYLRDKNKWSDTTFNTLSGIKVTAKGAGQKIRGSNEKGRPDLIYIDDLEEDEGVQNKDQRTKLKKWFRDALLPSKSKKGRIFITGTILHPDSLLQNIMKNVVADHIDWDVLFYQAIMTNEQDEEYALWPEMKPLSELMILRERDPQTFAQEYQNDPRSGNMGVFQEEEYKYIDVEDIDIDRRDKCVYYIDRRDGRPVKRRLNIQLNTDHALSVRNGADFTVLMISGMDSDGKLYILEYLRFQTTDTKDIIDQTFELMKKYHCRFKTMEDRLIQKALKRPLEREMERRNYYIHIEEISRQDSVKLLRIKTLRVPIKMGKVFWVRGMTELENELNQVTATSLGTHDDVIDCLADAYQMQMEVYEEEERKTAPVNSMEWLIESGLLPTTEEEQEMADLLEY